MLRFDQVLRRFFARGATLLQASRMRRIERATLAAEHLARLDDLDHILARAEAFARELLPCDEARIFLGAGRDALFGTGVWGDTLHIALPGPDGVRIGWMMAARVRGPAFSADDEVVFEHLTRAVTLAVLVGLRTAELRETRTSYEVMLSRMGEGVAELDENLQFRSVNEAAARYLGFLRPQDIAGTSLWDLGPGSGAGQFGALCQTVIETHRPVWATARFLALKTCFELRAFPQPGGLTALFRDVTAEREAEQRLRHSKRLEALGQLTGGVAHDVNNLLMVMLGDLETLAARAEGRLPAASENHRPEPPDSDLSLALAALRAGESATHLIRRVLEYSRGQPGERGAVDVASLLTSLELLIERALGSRIRLQIACDAGLWHAVVDPAELESAMVNLALNAQDAMPDGGLLTIAAENVEVDRLYAKVGGFDRTGAFVMISVVDTGAGMTREIMQRAFDPFFSTKAAGKGTGLGLSSVHGFAHEAGGHVLLDSEPGRGTILRIYLPRARQVPPTPAGPLVLTGFEQTKMSARANAAEGHEHVLLVEDNALVRGHTETMLRSLGYDVTSAADGSQAEQLLAEGLRPALLLTDVVLPGGATGLDLARTVAKMQPGLPVLFTSGHGGGSLLRQGGLPLGVALLPKPYRRTDLAIAVRSQLDAVPRLSQPR